MKMYGGAGWSNKTELENDDNRVEKGFNNDDGYVTTECIKTKVVKHKTLSDVPENTYFYAANDVYIKNLIEKEGGGAEQKEENQKEENPKEDITRKNNFEYNYLGIFKME